jgi:molybdopterin converting factor small subunit
MVTLLGSDVLRLQGHETDMNVEVELFATLRKYGPPREGAFTVELAEGDRMRRLIEILGIPLDMERVILINGRPANLESPLEEGDRIVLFPPVAGG